MIGEKQPEETFQESFDKVFNAWAELFDANDKLENENFELIKENLILKAKLYNLK